MKTSWSILLVQVAGVCLAVMTYFWLFDVSLQRLNLELRASAEAQVLAIERSLEATQARLQSLALVCRQEASPETFQAMVAPWLADASTENWFWAPYVGGSEISEFLARTRQTFPDFDVRDVPNAGSDSADFYLPIVLAEPAGARPALEGLDLAPLVAGRDPSDTRPECIQGLCEGASKCLTLLLGVGTDRPGGYVGVTLQTSKLIRTSRTFLRSVDRLHISVVGPDHTILYQDPPEPSYLASTTVPMRIGRSTFQVQFQATDDIVGAMYWRPWFGVLIMLLLTLVTSLLLKQQLQASAEREVQLQGELAGASNEQSRARQALERSEELFQDLFLHTPALMYTHDLDGLLLTVNPAAAASLGYEGAEMAGKNLREFILPTERSEFDSYLEQVRNNAEVRGLHRLFAKNGSTCIWLYHNIRNAEEVRGHALDVTESKRAERELERVSRQMEMILNSAGEGIFGVNLAGECTFINPTACALTGYSAQFLQTSEEPVQQILMGRRDDGEPSPWESSAIFQTLQDRKLRRVTGEVMNRKNGTNFPVEYVCTALIERDRTVGAVVSFQDVTQRQAVERMKDEFVSVVSHELRTPLTSIRGSLGLLASGVLQKDPSKAEAMLKIAVTNTDRLMRLINDILDIERLKSGRVSLEKKVCPLADLMEQAAAVMDGLAHTRGVQLFCSPLEMTIYADPDRILQVLTNLLSNALKFSESGGKVWLEADSLETDGETTVLVQVRDQGRGIPADKLESIFERFQQVEVSDASKKGGTGLGLAICQTIVEQHGGRIWVESTLGEGATFKFTLPVPAAARAADSDERVPAESAG